LPSETKRIAVIGAGEMGHGIAELCGMGGYEVVLMDKFPEALKKAQDRIRSSLDKLVERSRITKADSDATLARISFTSDMAAAASGSDIVIEAVPEVPELKKAVLKEASGLAPPGAILASNTSNIRISELAAETPGPERVVGMHFFNPPVIMKLVEVIPGEKTDPRVVEEVAAICTKLGRTPVKVLRDSPGFIVNRINASESLFFCLLLDKRIATPEEVDSYARGQGLPMGPYELLDFVGIDVAFDSLSYFARALSPEYGRGRAFAEKVKANQLGKKTGRGFYDWSSGKASVPKATPTDKVSIMDMFALEINEAVKLIEEGVATPDSIEKGVTLGMNRPFGPIAVAKDLSNSEVKTKLEEIATKFDCKIFAPARSIVEGKMRDAIDGRLSPATTKVAPATAPLASQAGQAAEGTASVRLERLAGGVARIVLNRPKLNTVNGEVLDHLDRIVTDLWDDAEIRIVIVTGEGSNFCGGVDLSQFFSNVAAFMEFARKGQRILRRLMEIPKMTIAVLKGYALGGGLELALSCDLRIATADVQIGFPELTLGLVPAWSGSQRLARLIGLSRASSLILTGERISGRRAFEVGLATQLVPEGDPDQFAIKLGTELASANAPIAVTLAKRLLTKGAEVPSDVGLEMEAMAAGVLFGTDDLKEGISAFLGKRKAEFKGK
jgi:enoyl-CoA hydratase / 3-hydroxyacyl-CoA dehydrogenase